MRAWTPPRRLAGLACACVAATGPAFATPALASPAEPTVRFAPLVENFTLIRDSSAYVAASLDAPQIYPLRAGSAVAAAARSIDGSWVVVVTQDGQAACIPAADLGPYDPARAPVPLPEHLDGTAQAVDTATLQVNGHNISLAGVVGKSDDYAAQLQALLDSQDQKVHCTLSGSAYTCVMPNGQDIARAAIFNGAAIASPDANEDYRSQEQAARAAHRGIWK